MKITVLCENTSARPEIGAEHGLSLYITCGAEHDSKRILFDSGQSDLFARNAALLPGADLERVDFAVLSHGHYDHGGGLPAFLAMNQKAPVYADRHVFEPHYNGTEKYIGLSPVLQEEPLQKRFILTDGSLELMPGMTLFTCNDRTPLVPVEPYGLNVRKGDRFLPEAFIHEQYLLIEEGGKRILFSGCSHKGILNICEWVKPDILIGGFHFKKLDPAGAGRAALDRAAEALNRYDTEYYTCHCTGTEQYRYLKEKMPRLHYLSAGDVLNL